ncbi:LysR family transcriptional regulator [Microbispora corallina]|uniref:Transcriptional regulator n=1 Tax=Microbispora corallina TaxID=83302 RepID=A0ABQ4FYM2_9ACTN|nr:LysR family transcriptional regulator [Microbispora corallina]GIH39858.1 transcriptional regulator [Microbispora corallina]
MELRHLRYALALAEHGHVGRAAQALGVHQDWLREQVKALEADVGQELFERAGGGVRPTAAGRVFLRHARDVVRHLELAAAEAADAGRGDGGTLAVGFTGTALAAVLPETVSAFAERRPRVRLELVEAPASEQFAQLMAGHLDAGFVTGPVPAPAREHLASVPLIRERLVAVVSPGSPLTGDAAGAGPWATTERPSGSPLAGDAAGAGPWATTERPAGPRRRAPVPVAALAGHPLVLTARQAEPALAEAVLAMCRTAGFEPRSIIEASGLHTLLGLVACGLGVGVGPESLRRFGYAGVEVLDLAPPAPLVAVHLVHRAADTDAVLHEFRRTAEAAAHHR